MPSESTMPRTALNRREEGVKEDKSTTDDEEGGGERKMEVSICAEQLCPRA